MKISEKKRSALRYTIAFMLIFGTVTLNERSQAIDPASQDMTFEGKDIRCVIDMKDQNFSGSALKTGLTYELLKEFSNAVGANARIETAGHKANYVDSLKQGNIDILIVPQETEISDNGVILSRSIDNSVWVLNTKNIEKVKELNTWIATYSKSDDYRKIQSKYNRMLNPFSNLDKGIISSKLSPYDSTIRKYAKTLGWDWRMLAAVIYQESKFSINTISYRGATGLMQVMPSTAKYYGVDNLLDPEQNIKANIHWYIFVYPSILLFLGMCFFSSAPVGPVYYVGIFLLLLGAFRLLNRILLKMGAEYVVTNKKVILKSGILSRDALELVLSKCEGLRINQSIMGRLLGFGSIVVTTGGVTNRFDFIADPMQFRNEINAQIQ